MNQRNNDEHDDEIRARLRGIDPALRDRPEPSWLPDLVEDTMSTATTPEPSSSRWRWIPLAAAAAVLAVAGAVAFSLSGDDEAPIATPEPAPAPLTVTELSLQTEDPMAMCARLEPALLSTVDLAFEGVATDVADGTVTLDVTTWNKGGDTDQVELAAPPAESVALIGSVEFVEGERYLVTATDGIVNSCGFSGVWSPELAAIFDEAFS